MSWRLGRSASSNSASCVLCPELAALNGGNPTITTVDGAVASVPYLQVERLPGGGPLVVWQKGGDVQDRDSGGELWISIDGAAGVVSVQPGPIQPGRLGRVLFPGDEPSRSL